MWEALPPDLGGLQDTGVTQLTLYLLLTEEPGAILFIWTDASEHKTGLCWSFKSWQHLRSYLGGIRCGCYCGLWEGVCWGFASWWHLRSYLERIRCVVLGCGVWDACLLRFYLLATSKVISRRDGLPGVGCEVWVVCFIGSLCPGNI